MRITGRVVALGAALVAVPMMGLPAAGAATTATTAGTGVARVGLHVTPSAPVSTKQIRLHSAVIPKAPATTKATGSVCWFDAATQLGCSPLAVDKKGAAAADFKTKLAKGSHSLMAKYSGDSSYRPASTKPVSVTVA
jgi:hypothetical protein